MKIAFLPETRVLTYLAKVKPKGVKQPVKDHEEEKQEKDSQEVSWHYTIFVDVLQRPRTSNDSLHRTQHELLLIHSAV